MGKLLSCLPLQSLDASSFKANLNQMPKEFMRICTFKAKTDWYSPKAEDIGTPYADLVLRSVVVRQDETNLVQYAWIGELASAAKLEIMMRDSSCTGEDKWFLPLGAMSNGAVITWPHIRVKVPTTEVFFFVAITSPELIDIRSLFKFLWNECCWDGCC